MRNKITGVIFLTIVSLLCFACSAVSADSKEDAAVGAASSWLALVDDGKYEESWGQASGYFRGAVSKEQWRQTLTAFRQPLGMLMSRKLQSAKPMTALPGAPDGEYVVIQFKTSFANKKSAVETVTPALEKDGTWRVSGYYIK